MREREKFFSNRNTIGFLSCKDTVQTGSYLEVVKSFARLTYMSVYVIDYHTRGFEYVSDNPLFLCGLPPETVQELGYGFYFRNVKEQDLSLLLKINEIGFDFFETLPLEERKDYTISYDFHIINEKKISVLVNHKLTPVFLTADGKIWKAMCIVALSPNDSSGNITISKQGEDNVWKYDLQNNKWCNEGKLSLSDREIEILRFYAMGLTITETAKKIFTSADTVKFHRRKLFEKIGVRNITEALAYATNNKLL